MKQNLTVNDPRQKTSFAGSRIGKSIYCSHIIDLTSGGT